MRATRTPSSLSVASRSGFRFRKSTFCDVLVVPGSWTCRTRSLAVKLWPNEAKDGRAGREGLGDLVVVR